MKLFGYVIARRRRLIVEEKDMMSVLRALDTVSRSSKLPYAMSMEVGNCGWADEPTKWFVEFDATDRRWKNVIAELKHVNHKIILKEDNRLYLT